jgi:hypothetical protein
MVNVKLQPLIVIKYKKYKVNIEKNEEGYAGLHDKASTSQ